MNSKTCRSSRRLAMSAARPGEMSWNSSTRMYRRVVLARPARTCAVARRPFASITVTRANPGPSGCQDGCESNSGRRSGTPLTATSGVPRMSARASCRRGNVGSCWGAGTVGQIGDGGSVNRSAPTLVAVPAGSTGWATVSAGANSTCAVTDTGRVYCWGANTFGQLGDGTYLGRARPAQVAGLPLALMPPAAKAVVNAASLRPGAVAPGGTVNGAHISLDVDGTSTVSGAGNALRATLGGSSSAPGGTLAVLQADTNFANSVTLPASAAFMRFNNTGTGTLGTLFNITTDCISSTSSTASRKIKCIDSAGTVLYLLASAS